jgi:two-component system sensor histidine kinase KdpD
VRRLLRLPSQRPLWARTAFALVLPAVVTVAGQLLQTTSTAGVGFFYMLAVVSAAILGGMVGGLTASFLSFLGLNFFFTPPYGTFRVAKGEDAVALFVFLAVSSLVATLFTQALVQRSRAEQRERETFLLYQLSSGLLSRQRLEEVLRQTAKDLVELFRLARCEIELVLEPSESNRVAEFDVGREFDRDSALEVPLQTERTSFGVIRLFPESGRDLTETEEELATAFATQMALAVEAARLDDESRAARADAEVSRIRAALFSSVTHDLKTPLSSIKASATSLLEQGVEFDKRQRTELLRTIVDEADRLNLLIGNLLQLSRLRAGALIPQRTLAPIEDVVASAVSRLRPLFDGRSLRVRIREEMAPVPMDVVQIDQVLSNILENAARYAPPGTEVEITAQRWQSWVEVLVADRGPGIPTKNRERVFDEFFRGESPESSSGSGLGLAIVRAIISAHGGRAWVQETPGGGATVAFRLPLTETDRA